MRATKELQIYKYQVVIPNYQDVTEPVQYMAKTRKKRYKRPRRKAKVDLISDLSDDLLLHVLRFLPDARDVVCTSVLSRRWSSLWMRAPVLRIGNWILNGRRAAKWNDPRFNDFLHNILARRADTYADIDTLDLRTSLWPGKSQADVWLRRAFRIAVTSLVFHLSSPLDPRGLPTTFMMPEHEAEKLRARHLLPGSTRLKTMSLQLDYAALLLPPTVHFLALTELTLCTIWFYNDDGPRLGHLLSSPSCCPRLQKLKLSNLTGLHDLRLDGRALETLHLEDLDVRRLDVDALRLSELHVGGHFMLYDDGEHTSITVRAPALKKLESSLSIGNVGQLERQRHTIQLLQQCRPIHGHVLWLHAPEKLLEHEEDESMTEIPKLPGVTNLTMHFRSKNNHYLGAIVGNLLARCSNLESFHLENLVHAEYGARCKKRCGYCALRRSLKNNMISLEHLRDVKLCGFSGQEHCCLDMVDLLASTPTLEKMIVTAKTSRDDWRDKKLVLAESLESSLPHGRGKWTACHATDDAAVTLEYKWMPNLEMLATA